MDGLSDGVDVGSDVGAAVGSTVGTAEGSAVGSAVGGAVGFCFTKLLQRAALTTCYMRSSNTVTDGMEVVYSDGWGF